MFKSIFFIAFIDFYYLLKFKYQKFNMNLYHL